MATTEVYIEELLPAAIGDPEAVCCETVAASLDGQTFYAVDLGRLLLVYNLIIDEPDSRSVTIGCGRAGCGGSCDISLQGDIYRASSAINCLAAAERTEARHRCSDLLID